MLTALYNFSLLLQILTPKLEPSLVGFTTTGKLILFFFINFNIMLFLKFFFFTEKNFGVLILLSINIFFEIILLIALKELITPECV